MPRYNLPRAPNSKKALRSPTREALRQYLREARVPIKDLSPVWGTHPNTTYRVFYDFDRPLSPWRIERAIELLKLDDFDANELRLVAAREAGWLLQPEYLNV